MARAAPSGAALEFGHFGCARNRDAKGVIHTSQFMSLPAKGLRL